MQGAEAPAFCCIVYYEYICCCVLGCDMLNLEDNFGDCMGIGNSAYTTIGVVG